MQDPKENDGLLRLRMRINFPGLRRFVEESTEILYIGAATEHQDFPSSSTTRRMPLSLALAALSSIRARTLSVHTQFRNLLQSGSYDGSRGPEAA